MKKVIFPTLILVFICALSSTVMAKEIADEQKDSQNISITQIRPTTPTTTRVYSVFLPIYACLDFDINQIEVDFNVSVGQATIYIINSMGQAISSYSCDTEAEWCVMLPIPAYEGYYTLRIVTSSAEYTGEFSIQ